MVAAAEEPPRRPRISSPAEKCNNAGSPPSSSFAHNRRRSLHNFSFPPTLAWGNQRVLRCVNLANAGNLTAFPTNNANKSSSESDPKPKPKPADEEAESSPARPWNLRTRRANPNRISSSLASPNPNPQPIPSSNLNRSSSSSPSPPSPTILQSEKGNSVKPGRSEGGEESGGDKAERCEFAVALTREEIEEDFVKMKGSKPPRRPKKRVKYVQRQLDSLFPGLWLSEITPDLYEIDVEKT